MTTLTQLSAKTLTVATRPEIQLILCCSRTHIDTATAEQIENLLQEDINWAYLIQMASQHGVTPLLYSSLKKTCPETVPQNILSQLRQGFHINALHNLCLTKELLNLLNLFEEYDIPVIPFKGPVLATCAYGNLSLRQFTDLDILVHEQDIQRAKDLLVSQGYRRIAYFGWEYHFICDNNQYTICVDLHQEITPWQFSLPLNLDYFQNSLETLIVNGETLYSFQIEDYLLILCIYLVRDFWQQKERLNQVCDISELLISHKNINWQRVIEKATFMGCKRILFMGLFCCQNLLNVSLSQDILLQMKSESVSKRLATKICQNIFIQPLSSVKNFQSLPFLLQSRERFIDKIKYLFNPNYKKRKLISKMPPLFSFFYYLIRPIRLIYTYIIQPFLKTWTNKK